MTKGEDILNRNRNQRIFLYRGRKLDHVVQEGNEPEYVKKHKEKKRTVKSPHNRRAFA